MIPNEGLPLIDGDVLANNPVLCAVAEQANNPRGKEVNPLQNLLVASFGTGQSGRRITPQDIQNWGALAWADLIRGASTWIKSVRMDLQKLQDAAGAYLNSNSATHPLPKPSRHGVHTWSTEHSMILG